ncbi:hypothetical protein V5279_03670 [Bradyrhizobium sp. 26S5]|uniref:hypothetical protein n=1 Tax=Bradyrhizobium sp. 26S5 TaxID=3139729 RepID=UPI0030D4D09E
MHEADRAPLRSIGARHKKPFAVGRATTPASANRLAAGSLSAWHSSDENHPWNNSKPNWPRCARAETLNSSHAAADAEFFDAKSKLQRHHLEADLDVDDKARAKLEAAVATCSLTRDGYADALAEVQTKIALSEQTLAAERPAVERKAASRRKCRRLHLRNLS